MKNGCAWCRICILLIIIDNNNLNYWIFISFHCFINAIDFPAFAIYWLLNEKRTQLASTIVVPIIILSICFKYWRSMKHGECDYKASWNGKKHETTKQQHECAFNVHYAVAIQILNANIHHIFLLSAKIKLLVLFMNSLHVNGYKMNVCIHSLYFCCTFNSYPKMANVMLNKWPVTASVHGF